MKIYTRGGDEGSTAVYVDKAIRVNKDDVILACYGSLDELNAQLGVLAALPKTNAALIQSVQQALFQIGFAVSASSKLTENDVAALEEQIDQWQALLPPQTSFILPGGCHAAAQAHVCRTVCRRAERDLVALQNTQAVAAMALAYINRLSDWLYVYARLLNHQAGISDVKVI